MAERTAKERREALAAWLDKVERQVKAHLRKLKLPDEIDALREHLSRLLKVQAKAVEMVQQPKGADEDDVTIGLAKAVRTLPKYRQGDDLLTALACLQNCRKLLKRREPEGMVMQAYVLGVRAGRAGLRELSIRGQANLRGTSKGGNKSGSKRVYGMEVLQRCQALVNEAYRKNPTRSWTALSVAVASKLKAEHIKAQGAGNSVRTPSARHIRSICTNPHKKPGN